MGGRDTPGNGRGRGGRARPEGERTEALRALTWAGAYASFAEDRLGSLEVGKLADLLVLSDDLLRISPEALKDVRVELTMIGGRIVHGAERF